MPRPIFTEDENGNLVAMKPAVPPSEDALQELIARFPEIVSESDGDLLLIRREQGVPDVEGGAVRWSLDHLFVSRNAVPVLIEVKRATDTRLRREVVGQLLDYAANGVAYWPSGSLEEAFHQTCKETETEPEVVLSGFLGAQDPGEFWGQVDANLAAGRVRLVVAADMIPPELARIIEFLNEQMKAEVRAVELRYFESEDGRRTLVPRVVGETERTKSTKGAGARGKLEPISVEEWLEKHLQPMGPQTLEGARKHMEIIEALGGVVGVASTQGSLFSKFVGKDGVNVWPLSLEKSGRVSVGFGWVYTRPALLDERKREDLLHRFDQQLGGLSTSNIKGHPSFPVDRLCDADVAAGYRSLARELVELAREA